MFAKYFTSIIYVMVIVNLSILNTLSIFWRAPLIATCGYKGNRRMKVEAVSPTLYTKITWQEDKNTYLRISNASAKDCMLKYMCLNSFWTSLVHMVLGGQIRTKTAKIKQYCFIFPSLLKGLKCHHHWELRNLWQIKGSCPETLLNDLLSFT